MDIEKAFRVDLPVFDILVVYQRKVTVSDIKPRLSAAVTLVGHVIDLDILHAC